MVPLQLLLFLLMVFYPLSGVAEELNLEDADRQCKKGVTVYCLALGLEEVKAGRREKALSHYRMACESHRSSGHLRACTPLLSLSKELGRLEEVSAPLEEKCRQGNRQLCFYLGKELLNIAEVERASGFLEPLCHERYRPPSEDDFGPCYHMARGWERVHEFSSARSLLKVECLPGTDPNHPSCRALLNLNRLEAHTRNQSWARAKDIELPEAMLLIVVLVTLVVVILRLAGGVRFPFFMRWGALFMVLAAWSTWEVFPRRHLYPPSVYMVFFFSVITLIVVSINPGEKPPKSDQSIIRGSGKGKGEGESGG